MDRATATRRVAHAAQGIEKRKERFAPWKRGERRRIAISTSSAWASACERMGCERRVVHARATGPSGPTHAEDWSFLAQSRDEKAKRLPLRKGMDETLEDDGLAWFDRLSTFQSCKRLIRSLDEAILTDGSDDAMTVARVKNTLMGWVTEADGVESSGILPEEFLRTTNSGYGRRALHVDRLGRYCVVVMTWGKGQRTAIHDHGSLWCVECVYDGVLAIDSYNVKPDNRGEAYELEPRGRVMCGKGSAGELIPPFDVHSISNVSSAPAVTIHVYGGHLDECSIFQKVDSDMLYEKVQKSVLFTHDMDEWYDGGESEIRLSSFGSDLVDLYGGSL
mmetsp:Transcript_2283/g.5319  ORF Transcript_2283/g.5319 Transcript_2283/m.5319 type:complete len:334 (-) Transcript_2283:4875-5876(-)